MLITRLRYSAQVDNKWAELIELLDAKNVIFAEGLSDPEVLQIQSRYGFRFPDDLRDFLQTAVPVGKSFTDWRSEQESFLKMLNWPLDGLLFDVDHGLWLPEWGSRPASMDEAHIIVDDLVRRAPRMIPIFAHRMMPDRPGTAGNPVLAVYQTDIIYYGFDLDDYLRHEFDLPGRREWPTAIKSVEFWDPERGQEMRWGEWPKPPWGKV
jgi:hypothetical protein